MQEKAVLMLASAIGIAAGVLFYRSVDVLSLPPLVFFVVDRFGLLPGSILVGLLSVPVAVGLIVLVIEWVFGNA